MQKKVSENAQIQPNSIELYLDEQQGVFFECKKVGVRFVGESSLLRRRNKTKFIDFNMNANNIASTL